MDVKEHGAETKTKAIYKTEELIWIDTETIMPNRGQPRTVFDTEALNDLAESIKQYGVLQPLSVRINPEKSRFSSFQYELIAGERRLRAAKLLGMKKVPCVLIESDTKTSAALAIIENLHRKDLNIFEEAGAIAALIEIYHLTQEQIAVKLSLTQAAVANKLRLLRLTETERSIILENGLTERHARALLRLKTHSQRLTVLEHIVNNSLNVKQSEDLIEQRLTNEQEHTAVVTVQNTTEQIAALHDNTRKKLVKYIEKAVERSRSAGIRVKTQQTETDSDIILSISIPKLPVFE